MVHTVTGGSGSGKSAYAEEWLTQHGKDGHLLYIATMKPFTEEAAEKIARHQRMRAGKRFAAIECYSGLKRLDVPENAGILLECVSNLTANELYGEEGRMKDWREALEDITGGIWHLAQQTECLVIVTNEVNSDINGYSEETECYRKLLGMVNQRLAKMSDRVTEVVYGIPVSVKKDEEIVE